MGYSCSIRHKDGSEYKVAMNPIGGTYMVNPPVPTEAWFSITFNYCRIFEKVLPEGDIKFFNGKSVDDTLNIIREAIPKLKDDYSDNYWEATEGNAKLALQGLALLAAQCPGGIWDISW